MLSQEHRVESLQNRILQIETLLRVKQDLKNKHMYTFIFKTVPSDYYSKSLLYRSQLLKCSTAQLCKSIVLHNTSYDESMTKSFLNTPYYCIILQYEHKLNTDKLRDLLCFLDITNRGTSEERIKKKPHFQLAPSDVNERITGFQHNAVCPFGLMTAMPIILTKSCASQPVIWIGGGQVDIKLMVSTSEFTRAICTYVADISEARQLNDVEDD